MERGIRQLFFGSISSVAFHLTQRRQLRSVVTLLSGSLVAQFIATLLSPMLSRIYAPDEFGVYGLFAATVSILSLVATARYELAVVLPQEDKDAETLVRLGFVLMLIVSSLIVLVSMFPPQILGRLGLGWNAREWLLVVVIAVLLRGMVQMLSYWANRQRHYRDIAIGLILQAAFTGGVSVVLGYYGVGPEGLMFGAVIGTLAGAAFLWVRSWQNRSIAGEPKSFLSVAFEYRNFPLFNLPLSFVNTFSQRFLIYALALFGNLHAAGYYGFSRMVLSMPVSVISQSLGRVYFKEAAVRLGSERFEQETIKLMRRIAWVCTPGLVLVILWGREIFSVVFGGAWAEAGTYASIYAPIAFFLLFTSWPERTFEVRLKQKIPFVLQLALDATSITLVFVLLSQQVPVVTCLIYYSLCHCLYHLVYLYSVFRVADFDISKLWALFGSISIIASIAFLAFALVEILLGTTLLAFIVDMVILGGYWFIIRKQVLEQFSHTV